MLFNLFWLYRDANATEQGGAETPTLDQELDKILADTQGDNQETDPSSGPDNNDDPAKDDQNQPPDASGPESGKKETPTGAKDDSAKEKADPPPPDKDKAATDGDDLFDGIDESKVPDVFKPVLEKVKLGYRDKFREKTTSLAEEKKALGELAKFSERAGDLGAGLQILDLIKKDPTSAVRFIQSLTGDNGDLSPSPAPKADDAPITPNNQDNGPNKNPLETFYAKAEALNFSKDQVNLFLELANASTNSVMEPFAQNLFEKYIRPLETEKENQGIATIQTEVAEMEGNSKDFPYYQQLKPAILKALQADPRVNSPKTIYNKIIEMTNIDKIVTDAEAGLARNIENDNRAKDASLVGSPNTSTGGGPTPKHGSVEDALDAYIESHGGFSQLSG